MSSAFRHISQGMAGVSGAPRPALVNWAGGVSAREHDINVARNGTTSAARPTFKALIRVMFANHICADSSAVASARLRRILTCAQL